MPMEGLVLRRGDSFHHDGAGGGGYGDAFARDPALVLEDVLDEKVSIEAARRDYGVVIDPQGLAVNAAETTLLRAERIG
jgi:N-methylhydantoinase B